MRSGETKMEPALAPYVGRLRRISELSAEWALPQAAHLLVRLMKDAGFLQYEVLPALEVARDAEDWCVARRY